MPQNVSSVQIRNQNNAADFFDNNRIVELIKTCYTEVLKLLHNKLDENYSNCHQHVMDLQHDSASALVALFATGFLVENQRFSSNTQNWL